MLKILLLSFYFEPDLCAGSFRAKSLVQALSKEMPSDYEIEVLTTMPNRYDSYELEAESLDKNERIVVRRFVLPRHQSGMLDQAKAFISYAKQVKKYCASSDYDYVVATSSRLLTAALGAYIAKKKSIGLYLDIRDIFLDTMNNLLSKKVMFFVNPVISLLESWTMTSAKKINLVSRGFEPYFIARYPNKKYSYYTNGVDDEFVSLEDVYCETPSEATGLIRVLYAGNIGEGQGLHEILPGLAEKMNQNICFRVIGDGGRKKELVQQLEANGCQNVTLMAPVSREALILEYRKADVLFLHLNDYNAFRKVLPSKIFEYAALGKPIWAGVAGFAADFVSQEVSNSAVFKPCDVDSAVRTFDELALVKTNRRSFIEKFARSKIMNDMARDILSEIGEC
ncbi:MAG: glycosyltransferase family 4 protein [Agarilytica sp.]